MKLLLMTGTVAAVATLSACAPLAGARSDVVSPEDIRRQQIESQAVQSANRLNQLESDNSRLLDEMRTLRGEVERLRFDLDTQQKRARESSLDLDRRLDRLEGSARRSSNERPNERPNEKAVERPNLAEAISPPVLPAPALPAPALPVPTSESARPTPFILPPPVVVPPPVSPTVKAPAAPAVIESADSSDNSNEEASYLRSLDSLSAGKYDEAIRGFKAQLEQYPRGSYADKAWFWMGDAQYLKRDLRQASSSYGTVIDRFSTSAKVPDALYKQGLCQFEQGQTEAAKTTWRKLVKDYPNSTAASNARKRLK